MSKSRRATRVVVVGLGYVGLPVALYAARAGYTVVGIDADKTKIDLLRNGHSYIEDVSSDILSRIVKDGSLTPSADFADAHDFDIAIIAVPTPLRDSVPDLSYIESAARSLAVHLRAGAVVVLESTTYPGTTEDVLVPILEHGSGLNSKQFGAGFSPERIDPGNAQWNFKNTPKIVSGIDEDSLRRISNFYSSIVDSIVPTTSPREAEMAKLLENTFRHINIAMVNELAIYARELGVDIWQAIDAASSKPFGFMKFTPGPGVGGHCLPVDPSYLSWQVRRVLGRDFRFVGLANDVNNHMPDYVVQRAIDILNGRGMALNSARVLLVGISYKKNSGDRREAPANRVTELLRRFGSDVVAADPHVALRDWPDNVESVQFTKMEVDRSDLVIILTDHDAFDYSVVENTETPILDTRHRTQKAEYSLF